MHRTRRWHWYPSGADFVIDASSVGSVPGCGSVAGCGLRGVIHIDSMMRKSSSSSNWRWYIQVAVAIALTVTIRHAISKSEIVSESFQAWVAHSEPFQAGAAHLDSSKRPSAELLCSQSSQKSPNFLWNEYIQASSSGPSCGPAGENYIIDAYELRQGIRTRPKLSFSRGLLKLLSERQTGGEHIRVLVLVSANGLIDEKTALLVSEALNKWSETFMNAGARFQVMVHSAKAQDTEWQDAKASLPSKFSSVDVIIDAMTAHDDRHTVISRTPPVVRSTAMSPTFENDLRRIKQGWIRSIMLPQSSIDGSQRSSAKNCTRIPSTGSKFNCQEGRKVPLLLLLEASLVDTTATAWHGCSYSRVTQQLADWYQIPFLSTTAFIQTHPFVLRSGCHLQTALRLLQYALLDFTIDYCQHVASEDSSLDQQNHAKPVGLLHPGVASLVEHVAPPPLDLGLSLRTVSDKWNKAAGDQVAS